MPFRVLRERRSTTVLLDGRLKVNDARPEQFGNDAPIRPFSRLKRLRKLARPERLELPTPRFVVWCSIQLSYGRQATTGRNIGAR
jgi:hypothetical protein